MIFMPWKQLTSLRKAHFASKSCSHVQAIQDTHTAFLDGARLTPAHTARAWPCSLLQCLCPVSPQTALPAVLSALNSITGRISNYCSDALMFVSPKPPSLALLGNSRAEPSALPCSSSSCLGSPLDHGPFPHGIVFI